MNLTLFYVNIQLLFPEGHGGGNAPSVSLRVGAVLHLRQGGEQAAENLDIDIDPIERQVPIMLHGPVAAAWLELDADSFDPRVIEAVRHHTTGTSGMSTVAKVVFIADKLEPNKVQRRPSLDEVRQLASVDIDTALLEYLNREIVRRIERGDLIHPSTLELRNELAIHLPGNELVTGEKLPMKNRTEK